MDKKYSISGHALEFDGNIKRNIDVYINEPSFGVNNNTGYFLLLHPGAFCAEDDCFVKMREEFSDRYNLITIGVNYLGTSMREYYMGNFSLLWEAEHIKELLSLLSTEKLKNALDRQKHYEKMLKEEEADINGIYQSLANELIDMMPDVNAAEKVVVSDYPPIRESKDYRDYGFIQAMDCIYALKFAMDMYAEASDKKRVYLFGSCLSAHLAQICAKFAPHTFSLVIDVTGFTEMGRRFMKTTPWYSVRQMPNGFKFTVVQQPYYSDDLASAFFLSEDMIRIRNMSDSGQLKVFAENFKGKILMFHGENDVMIGVKKRIKVNKLLQSFGINSELKIITEDDVDGVTIKSSGHDIGDTPKELIERFCDTYIKEDGEKAFIKESPSDFEIKSIIKYPGKEYDYIFDYSSDYPRISKEDFTS